LITPQNDVTATNKVGEKNEEFKGIHEKTQYIAEESSSLVETTQTTNILPDG
jgi:hypothetical protein